MADEPKKEEIKTEPPKKGKSKLLIIILAGAFVVSGIGGGVWYFLSSKSTGQKSSEKKEQTKSESKKEGAKEEENSPIFSMDPFVVNLMSSQQVQYLKVTIKLQLKNEETVKEITDHLPQVRDTILILLSSKDYAGVKTVEGKMELRDEIIERVNTVLKGEKVKAAYFTDFVVQ
ncbi:MAG: flagellar basal body-associated FliL family protein [Nitrospirae bacterium]|nr:flagellar basal body-associated FliL family protein [Nitrospirota bacterium]MBI3352051.1 flagellar basal body-associated FliL family protein [Nitrospirota bacterium]